MEILNKLDNLIQKYNDSSNSSLSFLELINMERSETAVSLLLKYLFENDSECLKKIIAKEYNIIIDLVEIENVITEYVIYEDKRIDILIEAKFDNEDTVVVIENKIDSHEHSDQCQKYYDYIEFKYSNTKHKFYFYLKPSSNLSVPGCNKFKNITYDDIYNFISNDEDIYIQDFKKCIERNYMNKEKNELELVILNEFDYFYKKTQELNKEFERFLQHEAKEEVQKELGCKKTEFYGNTLYTLRFYDEECWSEDKENKDDMFYFYVEIVAYDKKVNNFKFSRIIKAYSKNYNSKINRFVKNMSIVGRADYRNDIWYVIDTKDFITDKSILSSEWKKELIEAAKIELSKMYKDMINCVKEFEKFE